MSKRLQVLLDDEELREIRKVARSRRVTVAEWVRQTLRAARREIPTSSRMGKLDAIRDAARHRFPAPPIEDMLEEIEKGYLPRS
jgi:hypothetical protein